MTARPWGTTGRVTLEGTHWGYAVKVTGAMVGVVASVAAPSGPWRASIHFVVDITGDKEARLPSLDAAVMWVLRRVVVEVWRQERGSVPTVWRSRFYDPGKWRTEWRGGRVLVLDTHAEALAAALGHTP